MTTDNQWIRLVDHRVSTALILFLLLMLAKKEKRSFFPLRAGVTLVTLCTVSWLIRYLIDLTLVGVVAQGLGHSFHLLAMSLLYLAGHAFCYKSSMIQIMHSGLVALTIYKMAWNTFKTFASATHLINGITFWSTYSIMGSIVSYIVYLCVCIPAYRFHHSQCREIDPNAKTTSMNIAFALFLFLQILLEFCGRVFTADASARFLYYLCALMYTVINYTFLIALLHLVNYRRSNEDLQNFIRNKMQYYQMSRDGITSLQIKCHDLKHQIAAIRSQTDMDKFEKHLARLEDCIIEYGTVVECGNETINTVLTEKNILSATNGVKFSYMLDGSLFDFMSEMEIYSLFGNALDNALESCTKVSDPEKRFISLKANSHGSMVVLHVENCFEEPPTLVDGMPVTNKKGSGHGFGLLSIQQIAEKYGGTVSVQVDGQIFKLNVIMNAAE